MLTFNDDIEQSDNEHFDTAVDTVSDDSHITMGQPMFSLFVSYLLRMPTEKVGCLQVIQTLQQFLDEYPPKTQEDAFETIYHILEQLEEYLFVNPQQYTHCMSPDSEYVILCTHSLLA